VVSVRVCDTLRAVDVLRRFDANKGATDCGLGLLLSWISEAPASGRPPSGSDSAEDADDAMGSQTTFGAATYARGPWKSLYACSAALISPGLLLPLLRLMRRRLFASERGAAGRLRLGCLSATQEAQASRVKIILS